MGKIKMFLFSINCSNVLSAAYIMYSIMFQLGYVATDEEVNALVDMTELCKRRLMLNNDDLYKLR